MNEATARELIRKGAQFRVSLSAERDRILSVKDENSGRWVIILDPYTAAKLRTETRARISSGSINPVAGKTINKGTEHEQVVHVYDDITERILKT